MPPYFIQSHYIAGATPLAQRDFVDLFGQISRTWAVADWTSFVSLHTQVGGAVFCVRENTHRILETIGIHAALVSRFWACLIFVENPHLRRLHFLTFQNQTCLPLLKPLTHNVITPTPANNIATQNI